MKQNNYFSMNRFSKLLRNDWLINQKTYLYTVIAMSIFVYAVAFMSMQNSINYNINNYIPLLIFTMTGIAAVIGNAFPVLKDQIKTTGYLMTPGSTFEKFTVQFLIRIVIFIPLALAIFWIDMHLAKASLFTNTAKGFDPAVNIPDFHFSDSFRNVKTFRDQFIIVLSIFSGATVLFAGSVYFKGLTLVKTLITQWIITGIVILIFVIFSHLFFPVESHGFKTYLPSYQISEDLSNVQLAVYLLGGLTWLFFLPFAYFKLKEKEV